MHCKSLNNISPSPASLPSSPSRSSRTGAPAAAARDWPARRACPLDIAPEQKRTSSGACTRYTPACRCVGPGAPTRSCHVIIPGVWRGMHRVSFSRFVDAQQQQLLYVKGAVAFPSPSLELPPTTFLLRGRTNGDFFSELSRIFRLFPGDSTFFVRLFSKKNDAKFSGKSVLLLLGSIASLG